MIHVLTIYPHNRKLRFCTTSMRPMVKKSFKIRGGWGVGGSDEFYAHDRGNITGFPNKLHPSRTWFRFTKYISCVVLQRPTVIHTVKRVKWTYSCTETEMSSFWWNFHHWLHWKLSKWQLPVQPVMKISSKWRHFRFSVNEQLLIYIYIYIYIYMYLSIKAQFFHICNIVDIWPVFL